MVTAISIFNIIFIINKNIIFITLYNYMKLYYILDIIIYYNIIYLHIRYNVYILLVYCYINIVY